MDQELSNIHKALANSLQAQAGSGMQGGVSGSLSDYAANVNCQLGYWPYQPYQWTYHLCPALSNDEELLLNAIRRDVGLKKRVMKAALAELLKLMEKEKS